MPKLNFLVREPDRYCQLYVVSFIPPWFPLETKKKHYLCKLIMFPPKSPQYS